jgi:hypothetical protein
MINDNTEKCLTCADPATHYLSWMYECVEKATASSSCDAVDPSLKCLKCDESKKECYECGPM